MRARQFLRENGFFLALILALIGAFILLRTKGTRLASLDEFDRLISSGQPVIVEFYGNT
jgi:hypothetical protein